MGTQEIQAFPPQAHCQGFHLAARDSEQRPQSILSLAERSDPKVMSMHKELSVKSRVRGDFHARFCERVRVKLPRSTRPCTASIMKRKKKRIARLRAILFFLLDSVFCINNIFYIWFYRFYNTTQKKNVDTLLNLIITSLSVSLCFFMIRRLLCHYVSP